MLAPAFLPQEAELVESDLPESRVLIIGTGGTICMRETPDGLAPSKGFLQCAMEPRPTFNDMSNLDGQSFSSTSASHSALSLQTSSLSFLLLIGFGILRFPPRMA